MSDRAESVTERATLGSPRMVAGTIALCAATLFGAVVALTLLGNLIERFEAYAVIAFSATLLLLLLLGWLNRRGADIAPTTVIVVAMVLRLAALPMAPSLTDDPWRYIWDGRLVLDGVNPYLRAPSDHSLVEYRDDLFDLQGHPETPTVYPPLAQALFAIAAIPSAALDAHTASYYLLKCLLLAIEIGAIAALVRLLRSQKLPARGAIIYAWHPLVAIELAGQGHLDGLWVAGIALALWGYARRGGEGSGGGAHWLVAGAAARLYPATLLPLWWRALGSKRFARALLPALPLALLAYPLLERDALAGLATVVARFTNFYEFNGGFYYIVKWCADVAGVSPSNAFAGGVSVAAQLVVIALVTRSIDRNANVASLATAALIVTTASAALGAKAHVWYFTAPLALVALCGSTPLASFWKWVSLVAPLTYAAYTVSPPKESKVLLAIEWGGGACVFCWAWWRARSRAV